MKLGIRPLRAPIIKRKHAHRTSSLARRPLRRQGPARLTHSSKFRRVPAKYEVDKTTGLLKLDRVIYSSFHYPLVWLYSPEALDGYNDPLDILVLSPSRSGPLPDEATVIGNMRMIDQGRWMTRSSPWRPRTPRSTTTNRWATSPTIFFLNCRGFFEQWVLENKKVEIDQFQDKDTA